MTSIIIQFSFLFLNLTRIGSNYKVWSENFAKISEVVFLIIVMATEFEKKAIENIWLKGLNGWFFFCTTERWVRGLLIYFTTKDRETVRLTSSKDTLWSQIHQIPASIYIWLILFQFSTLARFCSNNKFYWRPPNPRSSWILQRPNSD